MFYYPVNDNIRLKLLTVQDAVEVFALTDTSRHHLRQWLPWVDETKTADDTRSFIQTTLNQFAENNGFHAGIWYKGQLAGCVGLHGIHWSNRHTSIGYWLAERFQGHGIMTQSVRAVVDIAFRDYKLNRIEIRAAVDNLKSRAIPERLGFQNEGCIRQAEWIYDHFVDHIVYGMLAQDWINHEG
jgi:ribosomal-protein-serine acetyltransferase